jgi:hypothetical protein
VPATEGIGKYFFLSRGGCIFRKVLELKCNFPPMVGCSMRELLPSMLKVSYDRNLPL